MPIKDEIKELQPSLFLLYTQLLEQISGPTPAIDDVSFKRKEVDSKYYWLRRVKIGSTVLEQSLGRETDELLAVIEREKKLIKKTEKETKTREDLVAMLTAGGANKIDPLSGRVLTLLEGAGVFAAGGVLVGSHAFNVYGNMLGYKFPFETSKTADIDLSISIGVTKQTINLKTAMLDSGLGFLEIPALDRKTPSTSYKVRDSEIKVDLLTPLVSGPNTSKPVYMPSLKSYAYPLRYLDYLIKDPISAVVVSGKGILVNIPQPSRYAIHKLVLSIRRSTTMQLKAVKDLKQAACLLEVLSLDRPADLYTALIDVCKIRGRKYKEQMLEGFEKACNKNLLTNKVITYFEENWEKAQSGSRGD